MQNDFEDQNCPVCNNAEKHALFEINYRSIKVIELLNLGFSKKIWLYKCSSCGHHYASPQINDLLLDKYYRKINSEYFKPSLNVPDEVISYEEPSVFELVTKEKKTGKVLEIGCGTGFLLNRFKESGWQVYGIEPSPFASKITKEIYGIDILSNYIDETIESNQFDVVLMLDVIEHIKDPNKLISDIQKVLKKDGILIIGTGNINSFNARLCLKRWAYFGSYEHISFYSPQSINYLLKRNGLYIKELIKTSYQGTVKYNLIRFLKNLFVVLQIKLFNFKKNVPLTRDHMIVIAKKCD